MTRNEVVAGLRNGETFVRVTANIIEKIGPADKNKFTHFTIDSNSNEQTVLIDNLEEYKFYLCADGWKKRLFTCCMCGGDVVMKGDKNRTRVIRNKKRELETVLIPDWWGLPTCISCGEYYMSEELSDILDPYLEERNNFKDVNLLISEFTEHVTDLLSISNSNGRDQLQVLSLLMELQSIKNAES